MEGVGGWAGVGESGEARRRTGQVLGGRGGDWGRGDEGLVGAGGDSDALRGGRKGHWAGGKRKGEKDRGRQGRERRAETRIAVETTVAGWAGDGRPE